MKSKRFRNFMIRITKGIVVLFLLVAGISYGLISWQNAERLKNSAVNQIPDLPSIPVLGSSTADPSTANGCRSNLQLIHRAKNRALSQEDYAVGSPSWSQVTPYTGNRKPVCPGGGSYSLNSYQVAPACSISSNGTADRGDDHVLQGTQTWRSGN